MLAQRETSERAVMGRLRDSGTAGERTWRGRPRVAGQSTRASSMWRMYALDTIKGRSDALDALWSLEEQVTKLLLAQCDRMLPVFMSTSSADLKLRETMINASALPGRCLYAFDSVQAFRTQMSAGVHSSKY